MNHFLFDIKFFLHISSILSNTSAGKSSETLFVVILSDIKTKIIKDNNNLNELCVQVNFFLSKSKNTYINKKKKHEEETLSAKTYICQNIRMCYANIGANTKRSGY